MIIKIADKDFTITQAGCPISISPVSQNVPADGGTGTVNVTAASNCQWQATSNASWITMVGGGNYSVSANTGTSSRTGTITIGDKTFTVTQPGGSACAFSINPASQSYGASSGDPAKYVMGSFALTASSPGCFWETTSHAIWIRADYYSRTGSGSRTISYYVADNFAPPSRTGTIAVGGKTFTVTQGGQNCIPTFTPKSQVFTSAGGTGTVSVTAPSDCPWTVRLQEGSADPVSPIPPDFITITSAPFGTGNGTITYSVAPNTRPYNRGAYVYVGESQFALNQEGGSACQYTLVSAAWIPWMSAGSAGGPSSVQLFTTSSSCAWQATSNAPWITMTSPSGKGDANVTFSVAANNTGLARTGTLTIGGQTLTLAQLAAGNCTYTLSPTQQTFDAPGGSATVSVTPSSSSCTWTAVAVDPWITITSGQSGKGNGTVSYTVSENTVYGMRYGTITIGGWMLLVGQYWPGCSNFALSPASQSFGAAGGTGTVTITGSSGCYWTTLASVDWITVTSGVSGVGKGTATYAVAPNTSSTSRTGQINFGNGGLFAVNQDAGGGCNYSIGSNSQPFSAAGGSGSVNVTAGSGCTWTASSNAGWITVSSGSGSGNGSVGYSVATNSSTSSRTGTLTIAGQTFTVTQSGMSCAYAINPTSQNVNAAGGSGSVSVSATSGCAWTASSNVSWITVTGGSGSGSGSVGYSVTANSSTTSRTGTMTIANQTFTATQAAQACTYSISPTSNSFSAGAGTGTVSVTSASGCTWTATSNNTGWLTVTSGASGSGSGKVTYSIAANTATSQRNGTLTIAGQTFTVSQAGTAPVCSVNLSVGGFNALYAGRQLQFAVQAASTCSWSASTNAPWITFISGAGKGNGTVTFLVSTNTGAARTGTITIGTSTVTVNQAGPPGILSVAPASLAFGTISNGSTSVKPVTVSNTGQADLKITSITIDTLSGSVTSFSQSNTCGTVSPGGSCTISVKFAPGGQGTKSTYLYVYSDGGIAQLALTGSAQ